MSNWQETHLPCPKCDSSDGYAVDNEGWGHCFACGVNTKDGKVNRTKAGQARIKKKPKPIIPPKRLEKTSLAVRKLKTETVKKFGYGWGRFDGKRYQVATYCDAKGYPVAQKLRGKGKKFMVLGDMDKAVLWNQHKAGSNGKHLVVTEGEIDAMTVSQVMKWRSVVSVPNGAQGAKNAIKKALTWLSGFEKVTFCFDGDEAGRKAAEECARMLPPGRAFICHFDDDEDANDLLKQGRSKELVNILYGADEYRIDGLVTMADIIEEVREPVEWGIEWPWETMDKLTFGRRRGELHGFGAGTGIGKTDLFAQTMEHTLVGLELPVGGIFLEQAPRETLRRILGKAAQKKFHVPDGSWDQEDLDAAIDEMQAYQQMMFLYDHFGGMEWDRIEYIIRSMVGSGCQDIFLDHMTALASAEKDERKDLDRLMKSAASLVHELDFTLYFISHLNTPKGIPHEEGGKVSARHFRGSRALGFWSDYLWGLERNQQARDLGIRCTTRVRCIKDRLTGAGTGECFYIQYDQETGILNEVDEPKNMNKAKEGFKNEDDESYEDYED